MSTDTDELDALWARHHAEWRDTAQIASHWEEARAVDPELLRFRARGRFWESVDRARATLFVTREYEHLVMALTIEGSRPRLTYMRLPHPSGVVYDPERRRVHLASTRNPNQIVELAPVDRLEPRRDVKLEPLESTPLVPVASRFYPGCSYLHDLALVGGVLHANAVGENAVVRVDTDGSLTRVWWPLCIETSEGPVFEQNQIQLNSIAAGPDLESSFFSASSDRISARRPGHRDFPVDGRGVVFSGETREPVARGLTRPHSARLHRGELWVANSGYGEIGVIANGTFEPVARFEGWTRGLCFSNGVAFCGTSRVIPRFRGYAPGLDVERSACAVFAVDERTGAVLGSLTWPSGNQVFAIAAAPRSEVTGFPFSARLRGDSTKAKRLFYAFHRNGRRRP